MVYVAYQRRLYWALEAKESAEKARKLGEQRRQREAESARDIELNEADGT